MKRHTKITAEDYKLAKIKGRYHPMTEYFRLRDTLLSRVSDNASRFHKLAAKVERSLPRGIRATNDMSLSTTCIVLEILHKERWEP